jgi:hypothetical protein
MELKIEDIFKTTCATDRQTDANRIIRTLYDGGRDLQELTAESGLDQTATARALHYLQSDCQPPMVEKVQIKDVRGTLLTRYFLTEHAKRLAAPRRTVKERVHINGINGKLSFDTDGQPIIKGKKGAVYDVIKRRGPIGADAITEALGWDINVVYLQCRDLTKMQLIEYEMEGNKRFYKISAFSQAVDSPPVTDPPLPLAPTIDLPLQTALDKVMGRTPPTDQLTQAVLALMKVYDASDLVLTILSEQEAELKALREFREEIERRIS